MKRREFVAGTVAPLRCARRTRARPVDTSGNFIVIWERHEYDPPIDEHTIKARAYRADGTALTRPFFVTTDDGHKGLASVASDEAGNFVVTWGKLVGLDGDVIAQRFLNPEMIFRDGFDALPGTPDANP